MGLKLCTNTTHPPEPAQIPEKNSVRIDTTQPSERLIFNAE